MSGQQQKFSELLKNNSLVDALRTASKEEVYETQPEFKERIDTMLSILDNAPVVDGARPVAAYVFYPKYVYQAVRHEDKEEEFSKLVPAMLNSCATTLSATHPQEFTTRSSLHLTATQRIFDAQQAKWLFIHNEFLPESPNLEQQQQGPEVQQSIEK
jgi:hypothetical protein